MAATKLLKEELVPKFANELPKHVRQQREFCSRDLITALHDHGINVRSQAPPPMCTHTDARACAHTQTHTRTQHTHKRTQTHARTHTHTHTPPLTAVV